MTTPVTVSTPSSQPDLKLLDRLFVAQNIFFVVVGLITTVILCGWLVPAIGSALSLAMVLVILVVIAGYSFGVEQLFGHSKYTRTAPHTLVCMVLLGSAIVIRRTERGLFSILVGEVNRLPSS